MGLAHAVATESPGRIDDYQGDLLHVAIHVEQVARRNRRTAEGVRIRTAASGNRRKGRVLMIGKTKTFMAVRRGFCAGACAGCSDWC